MFIKRFPPHSWGGMCTISYLKALPANYSMTPQTKPKIEWNATLFAWFHGTNEENANSIEENGLLPKNEQYSDALPGFGSGFGEDVDPTSVYLANANSEYDYDAADVVFAVEMEEDDILYVDEDHGDSRDVPETRYTHTLEYIWRDRANLTSGDHGLSEKGIEIVSTFLSSLESEEEWVESIRTAETWVKSAFVGSAQYNGGIPPRFLTRM